jgi:YHS domain-containing protein
MYEDIVCNQPITAGTTAWVSRYHGEPYFFCSLECRERFEMEPEDYLPPPARRDPIPPAPMVRLVS